MRTTNDIGIKMEYVPGAVEWFADCVANYGAENVCVVNYVLSRRLRELFVGCLFAQDGLLHTFGIPRANLVWTDSKSDKLRPFIEKKPHTLHL